MHSIGNWKHEMERYNVGPHRKHSVWMMGGHKITDQDYTDLIVQANVGITTIHYLRVLYMIRECTLCSMTQYVYTIT